MKFKSIWFLLTLSILLQNAALSKNTSYAFDDDSYETWVGDYDGDGKEDLYLKAKRFLNAIQVADRKSVTPYYKHPSYLLSDYKNNLDPVEWEHGVSLDGSRKTDYLMIAKDQENEQPEQLVFSSSKQEQPSFTLELQGINNAANDGMPKLIVKPQTNIASTFSSEVLHVVGKRTDYYPAYKLESGFIRRSGQIVGAIAGAGSVSEADGSFSYHVPIDLPSDPSGLMPKLGISYNSSSTENGILGPQFKLSGLSEITVCRSAAESIDQRGVNIDIRNQYCLDNVLLITRDNIHYFPMSNPSIQVTRSDDEFIVKTADYKIKTYSYLKADKLKFERKKTWYLTSIDDVYSNRINIEYQSIHPAYIPIPIKISHPAYEVKFTYNSDEPDQSLLQHGMPYSQGFYLRTVEVWNRRYAGNANSFEGIVRYQLGYERYANSYWSRLTRV